MKEIHVGIIGGGLIGREMASAFARWCALTDVSIRPVLTAAADLNPQIYPRSVGSRFGLAAGMFESA